jgi:glycosyltransferase involved in cell wall biosynthesis
MHAFITIAGIEPEAGGPSRSVPSLVRHLAQLGVNVRLKSIGNTAVNAGNDASFLDLYTYNNSFSSKLMAINKMSRDLFIEAQKHTGKAVIHDQGIWLMSNHSVVTVARKSKTPLIVTPRGSLEPWSINHKAIKKKIAWQLYQKKDLDSVDVFHATSLQEAQNIRELGFTQPVAIVPNGVDVPQWRERKKLKNGDKKTILFLSRVYPKKGLLNLVNAWKTIKSPDWKIVIAGPDEANHRMEVEEAIRSANLQDCFEFVGPIDDVAKWDCYFQADLFVLPTFSENFGIVIAEALACGVPVITTTGTPWQELITHNCGWWIDIGVEPLAEALREAIALTDKERSEMGQRGRTLVYQSYSWAKVGKDMVEVYAWILGNGAKPESVLIS